MTSQPTGGPRGALTRTVGSLSSVLANPALRRVQLALVASLIGDGAYLTAITVFAYRAGGAQAVGLFTAAAMASAALLAPLGAAVADRASRRTTLLACDLLRVVLVAAAALCLGLESPWPVYVLAILAGVLNAPFRFAQRAWMPALARTPSELTAANAAASTVESLALFVGPALGGVLLLVGDVAAVLWLDVATFVVSFLLVLGVREQRSASPARTGGGGSGPAHLGAEVVAGFRLLGSDADLRNVTLQVAGQTVVAGATRVLLVVLAVDVVGSGAEAVGLLEAVIGAGSVVGGVVALVRVERRRLGRDLAAGVALWAAPLGLVALWPHPLTVVVALLLVGAANPVVDVNVDTIVQRMTPDAVLARAFGALDTCCIATKALGSLVTPVLLALVGLRWTLLAVTLPVLALALASRPRMSALDARLVEPAGLDLLRRIDWLAVLGPAALESLAGSLREQQVPAGAALVGEGEPGDDFYVIEQGTVTVTQQGRFLRRQGPGDHVGEIALLHDVARTATVTADTDLVLRVLDRATFLGAVSGEALDGVGAVAAARLRHTGSDRPPDVGP